MEAGLPPKTLLSIRTLALLMWPAVKMCKVPDRNEVLQTGGHVVGIYTLDRREG